MPAKEVVTKALQRKSINDAISFIKETLAQNNVIADKSEQRSLLIALGDLEETSGAYKDAKATFVKACALTASDGVGMKKRTNEELVLDATRCALCIGEGLEALNFLASGVRSSKDPKIAASVKLYEIWAKLVLETSSSDTKECIALLKTYAELPSMKEVELATLFTLWYVTGEDSWGKKIIKANANSIEAKVVRGDAAVLPSPFWYFIPHKKTNSIDPTPVDTTSLDKDTSLDASSALQASSKSQEKDGAKQESTQNTSANKANVSKTSSEKDNNKVNAQKVAKTPNTKKPNDNSNKKSASTPLPEKAKSNTSDQGTSQSPNANEVTDGANKELPLTAVPKDSNPTQSKQSTTQQPQEGVTLDSESSADEPFERAVKLQMGLFRERANAENLVSRLKDKGFAAYMTSEKRASGTTYFLVFVDEDAKQSMGLKLKSAGFECYPIFE